MNVWVKKRHNLTPQKNKTPGGDVWNKKRTNTNCGGKEKRKIFDARRILRNPQGLKNKYSFKKQKGAEKIDT
jgi:hypothetical protein